MTQPMSTWPLVALCVTAVILVGRFAAEGAWSPAQVDEATRLQDIVFFKERVERENPWGTVPYFAWSEVLRGSASGLSNPSANLPSRDAAKDGSLGLRIEVTTSGPDPAWRITIQPELNGPVSFPHRAKPQFDAYAYRPKGALEFDLRGAAKGKGLGVAFSCTDRIARPARLTSLDPYLVDSPDWQHVAVPLAHMDIKSPEAHLHVADRLVIGGEAYVGTVKVDLDNIVLRSDGPEPERGPVRVDHVGYHPSSRKVGLVGGSRLSGLEGRPFQVLRLRGAGKPAEELAFEGGLKLRAEFEPKVYGEWLYEADFTPLEEDGRYLLEVPGVGRSVPFFIGRAVYDYLYYHLARFFFYQRNGCALPPENAFEWARGETYTKPTPFASDETKAKLVRHGWFDAGDSRLFPGTPRVGLLLMGWELSRAKQFDGQLNIPESGNGLPDILDEVRWQVEYFREMQLESGACLGYLMTGKSGGNPVEGYDKGYEHDPDPRYIRDKVDYDESVRIGACLAMMARCLAPYDAEGARVYSDAALKAWEWACQNRPEWKQSAAPPWQDDLFWAAVEMWRLTGEERFHALVRELADTPSQWDSNAWKDDMTPLTWVSYALDKRADAALAARFRSQFTGQLDVLFELSAREPYGVAVYPHGWFHAPARMGETAALLLMAWTLTGQERYRALAEEYMHYVCGRNVYRLCAVSNVAPETYSTPFHMLEWTPQRKAWMPGVIPYMCVDSSGNLSRFVARRLRMTQVNWYFGEPCTGFNSGATVAAMLLMEGARYEDLIRRGAFPGTEPFRPGLPFEPTPPAPWGAEPAVPK